MLTPRAQNRFRRLFLFDANENLAHKSAMVHGSYATAFGEGTYPQPRQAKKHGKSTRALAVINLLLLIYVSVSAQQSVPDLAQLKAQAENGDAIAQDKLGSRYLFHLDYATAAEWFGKAAEHGNSHAQYELGRMLLEGRAKLGTASAAVPKAPDEAVKWLSFSAHQGYKAAQLAMGHCCEDGVAVQKDLVEAYKWYRLSAPQPQLDSLILKLTQAQIQEGEKRAREFVPHRPTSQELPEPQYIRDIKLNGISGPSNHRLAMINGRTFEKGEEGLVKVGQRRLKVRCLEVKERSAVVQVEGVDQTKELSLN